MFWRRNESFNVIIVWYRMMPSRGIDVTHSVPFPKRNSSQIPGHAVLLGNHLQIKIKFDETHMRRPAKKRSLETLNLFYLTFELRSANQCSPIDFRYLPIDSELGGIISRL
jgi:hypothetical protein